MVETEPGRAFPRLNDGSRMSGDVHVRFYERLGVTLPGATHLTTKQTTDRFWIQGQYS